ncbi:major facilitator superfamily domain-containing protein [Delphinella strobiligena]|nr:major facilitator superfamily domain-containing protein [Delphinella strobiligena]
MEKSTSHGLSQSIDLGQGYTPEEERRVVQKIDCIILPMMCLVFLFQYLDKQSLSYASVFGLITDLDMTSDQYSWCSSIFFIGQLVSEYPFIYLMSRFRLTKFVGTTIVIWGGICMCLAAPRKFAGFAAVRILLGFSEGAVSPAFVTITSYWYRKEEHTIRVALWISMNALAQIFRSLLMYGVGQNHSLSLEPWRVLFIICGALTAACGVLFLFIIPSGPKGAWFLNAREKEVLTLRMTESHEGGDKKNFSLSQLKEALLDPKAWLIFWFGVLVTMQSPVLTFASLIIKSLGNDKYQTMLYTAPSGAVQLLLIWIGVIGCAIFPRIGCVLLLKLPIPGAGWGVIASCIDTPWSILLSLSASNIKGNTKRSVTNAMFFIGYCAGCVAAPQLWTHEPRYFSGVVTAIVTWILLGVAVSTWWLICACDARADTRGEDVSDTGFEKSFETFDLTDKQDSAFRYSH